MQLVCFLLADLWSDMETRHLVGKGTLGSALGSWYLVVCALPGAVDIVGGEERLTFVVNDYCKLFVTVL